jgi:hypothetical protein
MPACARSKIVAEDHIGVYHDGRQDMHRTRSESAPPPRPAVGPRPRRYGCSSIIGPVRLPALRCLRSAALSGLRCRLKSS